MFNCFAKNYLEILYSECTGHFSSKVESGEKEELFRLFEKGEERVALFS